MAFAIQKWNFKKSLKEVRVKHSELFVSAQMQHFKLALKWFFFFVRELNPSSCKCYFLIWLMHIFLSWNFGFCNITEKLLFIPPPAKASVIRPSHMQTTSSRCWSLAKVILCFSTSQHSRGLCQQGTMPTCAPQFSHSPVPGKAVPGTSFLTCCPFIHSPMTSPSMLPAAWLPCADVFPVRSPVHSSPYQKVHVVHNNLTGTMVEWCHVWDSMGLWHGVEMRPLWSQGPFESQL